ncbi:hypothetical protein CNMCM7927_003874 [Aspergillus lentulus]|nr:hypothetical protein CNMCM7927_003874 [Aspergillus lentulus]
MVNLEKMVADVWSAGGTPILVTSLSRRSFDDSGHVAPSLANVVAATKAAAKAIDCEYVDLNGASTKYLNSIGAKNAAKYNLTPKDYTHLDKAGMIIFGNMMALLLRTSIADSSQIAPNIHPWSDVVTAIEADVSVVNGVYHLYYSVSTFKSQNSAIGLATSTSMGLNSWTDHGSIGIRSSSLKPYNAIDGNLFNDGGKYYMNFGSFWHDIYQAPMGSAATTISSSAHNIAYNPSGTHAVEGAFMYKHGGYYYLFYSAGICCGYDKSRPASGQEYKIKVCRSTSATGNFIDKNGVACTNGGGTVVLESHGTVYGPGGQGVFTDPTLGPVLYYHYVDTRIGYADGQKLFGWNVIDFSSGWPVV